MLAHSTAKVSDEHVNLIVKSILNKKQKNIIEQQQTFIQRNTDEIKKRNNYLVDKFTTKKRTSSSKENVVTVSIPKLISPKKKTSILIIDDKDDDNDFITARKRPKVKNQPKIKNQPKVNVIPRKPDLIKECLESIIRQIENDDVKCPVCNQVLSYLTTIDQRQQHVNRCLEEPKINNNEAKQQKSLLTYSISSSSVRKATTTLKSSSLSTFKCQICGMSLHAKHTYLSHLKKCSNQNSVQLKHAINFAAKTISNIDEPNSITITKKPTATNIKNRIIKMEVPKTEDDEQQQLAIALSASIKTALEPPNAFDILQAASRKIKTIDLSARPLWNVSIEEKLKLCSTRISDLCERLITLAPSTNSYRFPLSPLQLRLQAMFGHVNWWNITTTDPQDDEIPMTQLAGILDDSDDTQMI